MGFQVTIQDARSVRVGNGTYCSRGMRSLADRHGLSWEEFLKAGIDSDILQEINDAMVNKVIEQARIRNGREK